MTGDTPGIGAATVRQFVSHGARVVTAGIEDAATSSIYGRLDILVNHADIGNFGETPDLAEEQWSRILPELLRR